jgi:hypothetical protein
MQCGKRRHNLILVKLVTEPRQLCAPAPQGSKLFRLERLDTSPFLLGVSLPKGFPIVRDQMNASVDQPQQADPPLTDVTGLTEKCPVFWNLEVVQGDGQ